MKIGKLLNLLDEMASLLGIDMDYAKLIQGALRALKN